MDTLIKIDLAQRINSGEKIIIELGCGMNKKTNGIGIDILNLPDVDIVADLENGFPFLPDGSVDEIHSTSVIEHIENFEYLMSEIVRILKKNGKCYTYVPHFSNPYYYSDYTHSKFFGLYTFYYFTEEKFQLNRKVPNFYTDIRIKIVFLRLKFTWPYAPLSCRNIVTKLFDYIFNFNVSFQEYYERYLCYIFPCEGMEIIFTPDK